MKKIIVFLILVFSFSVFHLASAQAVNIIDGDLIKTTDNPDVYIVKVIRTKKFKRLILNPAIFNSYGHLKWSDIKIVSQSIEDEFKISELVIEVNADGSIANPKVFKVSSSSNSDAGERRWFNLTASEFEDADYDWDSIFHVNHTEASPSFYPEKQELKFSDIKQNTVPTSITITKISPNEIYNDKNSFVTIWGAKFNPGPTAFINTQSVRTIYINDTTLKVEVPSGMSPGSYSIKVLNVDGTHTTLKDALTIKKAEVTAPQQITSDPLKILSTNILPTFNTATFEWQTNKPSSSKIFIFGNGITTKVNVSESGISTRHIANIIGLTGDTGYSYEIESIVDGEVIKKQGNFSTTKVKENASIMLDASSCLENAHGVFCDVEVFYFENDQRVDVDMVTIKSDDDGIFTGGSSVFRPCSGGKEANSDGTQRSGNPISCPTNPSGKDGKPVARFVYKPSALGQRTLTATANGVVGITTNKGQLGQCIGLTPNCNQ